MSLRKLFNRHGDAWEYTDEESDQFTTIGGALMTYQDRGQVTMNTRLSHTEKDRGRTHLLDRLADTPVGKSSAVLWFSDDTK